MVNESGLNHKVYRHKPRTLAEYLRVIESVSRAWMKNEGDTFRVWFRGHRDSSWPLIPSIYRNQYKFLNEDSIRLDFKLRAFPYLVGTVREPTDEWDWYFIMQHYGLPTRLLDWTESPLFALYFAVRDVKDENVAAAVWAMDPWFLNETVAGIGNQVMISSDSEIESYLPMPYSEEDIPEPPIGVYPPHKSNRITAQKGMFTLHGNTRQPLESYKRFRQRLIKIEIPSDRVLSMKRELTLAGITETSVFPELTGLCQELLYYWSL